MADLARREPVLAGARLALPTLQPGRALDAVVLARRLTRQNLTEAMRRPALRRTAQPALPTMRWLPIPTGTHHAATGMSGIGTSRHLHPRSSRSPGSQPDRHLHPSRVGTFVRGQANGKKRRAGPSRGRDALQTHCRGIGSLGQLRVPMDQGHRSDSRAEARQPSWSSRTAESGAGATRGEALGCALPRLEGGVPGRWASDGAGW
jgi:hypothetical protein